MEIRIMTSNIWGDYFGNEVEFRDRQLYGIYQKYDPDIIGFQEVTQNWHLSPIWQELSEKYTYVKAEPSSANNYTPLIYKTERFMSLEEGWEYLPETPDESKTVTWAVLKDKKTDKIFACCNTHFWWMTGDDKHELLRGKNAVFLTDLMRKLEAKYRCPVFACGDFNCSYGSIAFLHFEKSGVVDLFDVAKERKDITSRHGNPVCGEDGRYHGVADLINTYRHPRSLDHIIGIGDFKVKKHDVILDSDALDATDHSPVYSDIEL